MSGEVGPLLAEIEEWASTKGTHYHNSDRDLFWSYLEQGDVELPSGTAEYVDIETSDDIDLAVFSLGGNYYALGGSSSSWGSDLDTGPYEVEKRTVTIERWETL